jgi:hypothetical protein
VLRPLAALPLLALLLAAPPAQAGTYEVRSCSIDGLHAPNRAWTDASRGDAAKFRVDAACPSAGNALSVALVPGAPGAPNTLQPGNGARLRFTAPPGTEIVDYALDLAVRWYAPPSEQGYAAAALSPGDTAFIAGGGDVPAARNGLKAEGRWFSDQGDGNDSFPTRRVTLRPADSAVQRRFLPTRTIALETGCWAEAGAPCAFGQFEGGPPGESFVRLHGSRVVVRDDVAPVLAGPAAGRGLLEPGVRSGGEGVVLTATDNAGIRAVQLLDVTDGGAVVVGAEDYAAGASTDTAAAA